MSEKINPKKLPSSDWDWLEENGLWDRNAAAKWYTPLITDTERALALIERTDRIEIRVPNAQLQRTAESLEGKNLIHLRGFGKLKKLIPPRSLNDEGLKYICELGKITALHLAGDNFTIEGFKHLANLTNLKTFATEWLPEGGEAIAILAALPKLVSLDVNPTNVTNADLIPLKNSNLKALNIGCRNVNYEILEHIGQIATLDNLMLGHTKIQNITDDSLKHLQGLTNLRRLTLKYTNVTEKGLVHLAPLKSLKKLQLKRDMCNSPEAKELKKLIPGLSIRDNA